MSGSQDVYVSGAGEPVGRRAPGARREARTRSGADIERQRTELGRSVEALRGRVAELTDWRRQIRDAPARAGDRGGRGRLRGRRPDRPAPPPLDASSAPTQRTAVRSAAGG